MPQEFNDIHTLPLLETEPNRAIKNREPYAVQDLQARWEREAIQDFRRDPDVESWAEVVESHFRSYLSVPIVVEDDLYGALSLFYDHKREISAEEIDLAMTLADQAALAIENARLRMEVEKSAAAAERSRLARDLHDAVTQTLFSSSLIADVLPRIWEKNPEMGMERLKELRELTRGALAEMRTLLLELRPAALTDAELSELLHQLAESITGRARVPVDVSIEGDCELPNDVKVALYRIAQESLNNVAKHSSASEATVRLRCADVVELHVVDDGIGFDPDSAPADSLGLGIMRERAEAIGAELRVESEPGHGTEVSVSWAPA
jgi:signal transduction histidine kinase